MKGNKSSLTNVTGVPQSESIRQQPGFGKVQIIGEDRVIGKAFPGKEEFGLCGGAWEDGRGSSITWEADRGAVDFEINITEEGIIFKYRIISDGGEDSGNIGLTKLDNFKMRDKIEMQDKVCTFGDLKKADGSVVPIGISIRPRRKL